MSEVLTAASALTDAPAAETPATAPTEPAAVSDETAGDPPAPAEPELKVPGKDATPEQWAEFYKAVGKPETADEYDLVVPEGDDGAFAKEVAPLLHKANLTKEQARVLSEGWEEMRIAANAKIAEQQAAAEKARDAQNQKDDADLKNEWGQNHTANMELAKRAVMQFLPKEKAADVLDALEGSIGYAQTIKFLHSIGKSLGEHDAPGLGQPKQQGRKSAAEILYGGG